MQASWRDVWNLGISVYAHQRIELQILIGLLAAFCAIMVIEGLRANFFPARRAAATLKTAEPDPQPMGLPEAPPVAHAMAPAATQQSSVRPQHPAASNPKRKPAVIRRQTPMRPTIKRLANSPPAS